MRRLARLVVAGALTVATLAAPVLSSTPTATAAAADLSAFDPGNIISDAVFFDSGTMTTQQVDAFLATKGANCVAGEMPCLKDYRQDTVTQPGDAFCSTYQGAQRETAGAIIAKTAQACGINPRVLIVLIQKEQGLVTGTRPSTTRYTKATGFGCPDTAACNPQFSGFVSQVYFAARQFQRYADGLAGSYRAGRTQAIQYHPNSSCGTQSVYIANVATAGLYNYTPYVPNRAALAAGYGTGDACSAYGNRNFYSYFTDWFGSTGRYPVSGAIGALWSASGGERGALGLPVSAMTCGLAGGGCVQHFAGGSVYWSPASGTQATSGAIRDSWAAAGWERGALGYPLAPMDCGLAPAGCAQQFQGGQVLWSAATGARAVSGAIGGLYGQLGRQSSALLYPTSEMACGLTGSSCRQDFQGGVITWSASTGAQSVTGALGVTWRAAGGESGAWGLPTSGMTCAATGCRQDFTGGTRYWSPAGGAQTVTGDLRAGWTALGGPDGPLGLPQGSATCGLAGGGCSQRFGGGTLYWSAASGAHAVSGGIGSVWTARGAERSELGYPTTDLVCDARGCAQSFAGGLLTWTAASSVQTTSGAIGAWWRLKGSGSGPVGYPVAAMTCTADTCTQQFQDALLVWSGPTGVRAVSGGIGSAWSATGGSSGPLGNPTADMTCVPGGCAQHFARGILTWTASAGVRASTGAISAAWDAQGGASGPLGMAVTDMTCGLTAGGCRQDFASGTVTWAGAAGTHSTTGAIREVWRAAGGEAGALGYPLDEMVCAPAGCSQRFQTGSLVWSSTAGVRAVPTTIATAWSAAGGLQGPAGPAVSDAVTQGSVTTQQFQGTTYVWDRTSGRVTTR